MSNSFGKWERSLVMLQELKGNISICVELGTLLDSGESLFPKVCERGSVIVRNELAKTICSFAFFFIYMCKLHMSNF